MIERRFKRSAFHGWLVLKTEALCGELQTLLQSRLKAADDTVKESKLIIEDLRSQGHKLKYSASDSNARLQVWLDGDFALWFWADSAKDVSQQIDRVEVLWQKM